jgi:hypothetical protein
MYGGTISGNTATDGGGIYLGSNQNSTMIGGTITSNTAGTNGGGVSYSCSPLGCTIRGGTISGNSASGTGGGVYVDGNGSGVFSLEGGTIAGNTAGNEGGGLYFRYIVSGGTFSKTGGTIYGSGEGANSNIAGYNPTTYPNGEPTKGHTVYTDKIAGCYRDSTLGSTDNISVTGTVPSSVSDPWGL